MASGQNLGDRVESRIRDKGTGIPPDVKEKIFNLFLFVENRSTEGKERDGYNGTYKTYVNSLGAAVTYHW